MEYFVEKHSVVRKIWGNSDTILIIFAGSSAEFALNKSVDWLYFTGRLPGNPLLRFFSTVSYARKIIFSEKQSAHHAIDTMAAIHAEVETKRGASIPQWAYRDVLYMLIDYSIRAFELLERKLKEEEKEEVFDVFYRVGARMGIKDLPETYNNWTVDRRYHLNNDLVHSSYTDDLYNQYKKHLGPIRYHILLQVQQLVCPSQVRKLLGLQSILIMPAALTIYKFSRILKMANILKSLFLPPEYKQQIKELDG